MTTEQLVDYYAKLLIIQYMQKPKALATVKANIRPILMDQLANAVQNAFTLGTAIGKQLDILGLYVGVTRNGFSLDGVAITLNDADFTQLIQIAIFENHSDGTLYQIQNLLHTFFNNQIFVFDHEHMRIDYMIDSTTISSSNLAQLFVTERLLPKPMAVALGAVVFSPHIKSFFGFSKYGIVSPNNRGMNTIGGYHTDRPWMNKSDFLLGA